MNSSTATQRSVGIVEVGPRDGLQNQKQLLTTDQKLAFVTRALDAGLTRIEATSFVNPKRVPQMADAAELMARVPRRDGVRYIGLALNLKGAERAIEAGCDEVGAVAIASDTFGVRNQGATIDDMLATWSDIAKLCRERGVGASIMISSAFGCPFEGEVPLERVFEMAGRAMQEDPIELAFADTIGVGDPFRTAEITHRFKEIAGSKPVRAHFHNTRNTGYANAWAAVLAGCDLLDASLGGIGGCPFAPNATGNIATEDLVYMLHRAGVATGVDLDQAIETGRWIGEQLGEPAPGLLSRAGNFPESAAA